MHGRWHLRVSNNGGSVPVEAGSVIVGFHAIHGERFGLSQTQVITDEVDAIRLSINEYLALQNQLISIIEKTGRDVVISTLIQPSIMPVP